MSEQLSGGQWITKLEAVAAASLPQLEMLTWGVFSLALRKGEKEGCFVWMWVIGLFVGIATKVASRLVGCEKHQQLTSLSNRFRNRWHSGKSGSVSTWLLSSLLLTQQIYCRGGNSDISTSRQAQQCYRIILNMLAFRIEVPAGAWPNLCDSRELGDTEGNKSWTLSKD